MNSFIVYGKSNCKFCDEAKSLLDRKGLAFEYRDISTDNMAYAFVLDQGFKTVPQIFEVDGDYPRHVGGFYDLRKELERRDEG